MRHTTTQHDTTVETLLIEGILHGRYAYGCHPVVEALVELTMMLGDRGKAYWEETQGLHIESPSIGDVRWALTLLVERLRELPLDEVGDTFHRESVLQVCTRYTDTPLVDTPAGNTASRLRMVTILGVNHPGMEGVNLGPR